MPRPDSWSRWWSTQGATHCVEVVPDRRFKTSVRLHFMNYLASDQPLRWAGLPGSPTPEANKLSLADFERWYQPRPRIDLKWINTGSVWRRLPRHPQDYPSANEGAGYCKNVFLNDLVVVDTINRGGSIMLARIEPNGTLEHYSDGFEPLRVAHFMLRYARVWSTHAPESPTEAMFPALLYDAQLLSRPVDTAAELEGLEDYVPRKPKRTRKKPARKRPRKARRGPSIWERLMADDDG